MVQRRGYWRESTGQRVTAAEAWDIWAGHAYDILVDLARTYHAVITYGELGSNVQTISGIHTAALLHNWIGPVLGKVVREAHRRGDPPLTSLVVHADDGKVGVGYKEVLAVAGEPAVDDELEREHHAAAARLRCYEYFGAPMPDDGGRPALAPRLEAAVARKRSSAPRQRPSCPNCFIQLPARGICDSCGYNAGNSVSAEPASGEAVERQ